MAQLKQLDKKDNPLADQPKIIAHLVVITSLIQIDFWKSELAGHPDQQFAALILKGLECGFRTGFLNKAVTIRSSKRNLISALEHPKVVTKYIEKELELVYITRVGLVTGQSSQGTQLSPLGVIPKKRKDQWRLIMDLSAPQGHSINDSINKELCSCHYMSVNQVAYQIMRLGKGTLMAKWTSNRRIETFLFLQETGTY